MRLLRHLAATYAAAIGLVLAVLIALLTTLSLVERTGSLVMQPGGLGLASQLAFVGAVELLPEFLPVAAVLGLIFVGTQMARRGEILALCAMGLRPRQLALPFVVVAALWASIGSVWADFCVPPAMTHKGRIAGQRGVTTDALGRHRSVHSWLRRGEWVLYLPHAEPERQTFVMPTLFRLKQGRLLEMIQAERLSFDGSRWHLRQASVHRVAHAHMHHHTQRHLDLEGTWEDLYDVAANPRHMRARHARALLKRRQSSGLDTTQQRIELFERFAQPWAAPIWVLLAAPWVLQPDRRRTLSGTLAWGAMGVGIVLALAQILRLGTLSGRLPIPVGGGALIWVAVAAGGLAASIQRSLKRVKHTQI